MTGAYAVSMVATTWTRARPAHVAPGVRPVAAWRKRWQARAEVARWVGRRAAYRGGRWAGRQVAAVWGRLAPASLSIAGLGSLTGAAWQFGTVAGLVALGLSCWILEWRISR